jgi:hypothetical protein
MSLLDESNRAANAKHLEECQGSFQEHLVEMERKFHADEAAMHDAPILAGFKERRRAQANQFKQVLLGKAQQLYQN